LDEREIRRFRLWKKIRTYHDLISKDQAKINILKDKMRRARLDYEEVDRELMMEKKTVLVPQGAPKKKEREVIDLSLKEVQAIADRLGVKIDIKRQLRRGGDF